jgi:tetratricopeptide (TPR) repeat protein
VAAAATHDPEAYDLFLKGEHEEHQAESSLAIAHFGGAENLYRQALARDPNFALAYARLGYSRLYRHWFIDPLAPAQLAEVKSILDRAMAILPDSSDVHLALGAFHYWGYRDYEPALREFDRTIELQPNNATAWGYRASIYRRRGDWERSLAACC